MTTTPGSTTSPGSTSSTLTPYLCVAGALDAVEWYRRAFGAVVVTEPILMDDGRVGHAELALGGARWMLSDPFDEAEVAEPLPGRHAAVSLHLGVDNCDGFVARVEEAGARVARRPADTPHGRIAVFVDPFGHRWMLNQPV